MFQSLQSARFRLFNTTRTTIKPTPRPFTTTTSLRQAIPAAPAMEAYKKSGNRNDSSPPSHEMVHFPGLMSSKRSFGDFRSVLHTGLFSQIVAMEVPVNGEIGEEVSFFFVFFKKNKNSLSLNFPT
jgi:hypothetical protein